MKALLTESRRSTTVQALTIVHFLEERKQGIKTMQILKGLLGKGARGIFLLAAAVAAFKLS